MSMNAAEAMTRNVVCVRPDTPLEEAYSLMTAWGVRHLPVLDGRRLVGVLSDRDVIIRATPSGKGVFRIPQVPVSEAMTIHPVTCRPTSTVSYVAGLMVEYKIDSVPMTDAQGGLAGLVTATDLLQLVQQYGDAERQPLPFTFVIQADLRLPAPA